jgi:hypothetical protein
MWACSPAQRLLPAVAFAHAHLGILLLPESRKRQAAMRAFFLNIFFTGLLLADTLAIIAFFASPYKATIFLTLGVLLISVVIVAAFFLSAGHRAGSRQDNL